MRVIILKVVDNCVCLFVVTPLTLLWWSGTWHLMKNYLVNKPLKGSWDSNFCSALLSLGVGSLVCVTGNVVLPALIQRKLNPNHKSTSVVLRVFVYIFSLGYINYWRGLWNMTNIVMNDVNDSQKYLSSYLVLACGYMILFLLGTTSSTPAVPYAVSVDKVSDFYHTSLCFGTQCRREEAGAFLADVVVTQFLVHTVAIAVWWCLWTASDQWLHIEDPLWCDITFLSIGYGLSVILLMFSIPLKLLSRRFHGIHRLVNYVFVVCVKFVATVSGLLIWKGGWQLCDKYIVAGLLWRSWVCHLVGFFGLLLLQVCSLLAPFGCAVDNLDDIELQGCFPTVYFNNFPVCMSGSVEQRADENIQNPTLTDENIQNPTEESLLIYNA